jgi:hypothetical protein
MSALTDAVGSFQQPAFDEFVKVDGRHPELFLRWKLGKITEESFHRQEAELVRDLTEKFHHTASGALDAGHAPRRVSAIKSDLGARSPRRL